MRMLNYTGLKSGSHFPPCLGACRPSAPEICFQSPSPSPTNGLFLLAPLRSAHFYSAITSTEKIRFRAGRWSLLHWQLSVLEHDFSWGAPIPYGCGCAPRSHVWKHFWLSQWGWGVEVRDAAEHHRMPRACPPTKNHVGPKVHSAEVGKPVLDCESHVPFGHQLYL